MFLMASSALASPLCTWLVAACASVAFEKDQLTSSSMFHSPKRLSQWARRKKLMSKYITRGGAGFASNLLSCNSGVRNLMSSVLAFELCNEYNSSKGHYSSITFCGDTGFSLFGSKKARNRRQRCINRGANSVSGNTLAVAVRPANGVITEKKQLVKQRRVVVTGMGVVTPIGDNPDVFYDNLLEGVSGISEIQSFDCSPFPTKIAGEIKYFSPDGWVSPKLSKRADKFTLYCLAAGKKALADAGFTEEVLGKLDKNRCGIIIGSALGGMRIFHDAIEALEVSYRKMNPFCIPFATTNIGSAILAMDLGWMGPNYSISTACATSNFCILNASHHIMSGESAKYCYLICGHFQDMILCGGSDAAVLPIGLGGFSACGALSQRNSEPTKASRPWDTKRDGFVIGDGAGVLLLEDLEHAERRGAKIYAEFLGGSVSCDAHHMTEPHPDGTGIVVCIEKALANSGVAKEDVNYINAYASSTPMGDLNEYRALIHCFGKNPELKVNSTKSMTGHLLGASGAVEAVATVKAIQAGWVHPNLNLESPDEGMDMNMLVGPKKEPLDIKVALSNSFGFGGHNSSILFAPYK
ncbi:3-oxoacyl-[acyl-carrier-protein] synthase II, chloroplastic-like isoform X1 [Juglans microcarpa x Juglans regia]|uniref:3-oxoacyl-[acyl-carrier-protein] synthase II, chloroplastic-like isoform X1 n=2 Tax=Juglans microcarpa x Juglans regia TaxID=2249226 RepID=UPI001B7EFDA3|nr:3-oxoacyl-[acyl-carrier-protein] synthase II, chloroplastic-like isoform X1 [Juglans microcarpa x Juglans regia]XP_041016360.1 3-oxoacyl-[acyl-carrier-protein] synthase II, chloroplastic-like isoform X1 [Juglans microcarpa x Juglans regia]